MLLSGGVSLEEGVSRVRRVYTLHIYLVKRFKIAIVIAYSFVSEAA